MYKILKNSIQLDNMSIPVSPANRHYQEFLDYIIEHGTENITTEEVTTQEDYSVLRQAEYPSLVDQLDMQYWDNINGTSNWQDTIDAIKVKYPKTLVQVTEPMLLPTWVQEEADAKLFARQLAEYKQAILRLEQYIVAEGREEVCEIQPTGEQVYNEETEQMEDVMAEVVVVSAIDPVEPTIEQTVYGDDPMAEPTIETIENPLITKDNAERVAAQAIVDATPTQVKNSI